MEIRSIIRFDKETNLIVKVNLLFMDNPGKIIIILFLMPARQ